MLSKVREEVINVILAELLSDRGMLSVPESIRRSIKREKKLPDITLADFWGVRITIEGKVNTSSSVRTSLFKESKKRVEDGISPICLAVLYPKELQSIASLTDLKSRLKKSRLTARIICETDDGQWSETDLSGLMDMLRRSYDLLVDEDVVARSVEDLGNAIERASEILIGYPSSPNRLRNLLGITKPRKAGKEDDMKACRVGSLTLANAMIFHQVVAGQEPRVTALAKAIGMSDPVGSVVQSWSFITREIDYVPIFRVALDILTEFQGGPGFSEILKILADSAMRITGQRAALRHDLMGRIYHSLLMDAKYYGAFYTQVPSATMLLKLALDPCVYPDVSWADVASVKNLRIADLASGTGTLLKAALQTMVDNHVRASGESGNMPDLQSLHRALVEDGLYGFDVVPFAIHLAASALAIHEPDVFFTKMHLYTLPIKGSSRRPKLGSLDYLATSIIQYQADLFGPHSGPDRMNVTGESGEEVQVPVLDLCVMNPPFTRSVGGNLLFGNLPDAERAKLQKELKRIIDQNDIKANITAGLGAPFAALGDKFVKENGQLALVLPRALLSGIAWGETRELIGKNYHVRYIIVSHEPGAWNFSENTSLSECMIVARKLAKGEQAGDTKIINLWNKPKSSVDALGYAEAVKRTTGVRLDGTGVSELKVGDRKIGEVVLSTPEKIQSGIWSEGQAFAQTELNRVAFYLNQGIIYMPGTGIAGKIPVVELGSMGEIGPDRRDIHDGFDITDSFTPYAAFWGHVTEEINTMGQKKNRYLSPLAQARPGRPFRNADVLWSRSGNYLFAERIRLNNARVLSVFIDEPVLSNTWWPFRHEDDKDEAARLLVMWFNSTFGILSLIASRVETEGAWIEIKKPTLKSIRVPDPNTLSAKLRHRMLEKFNALALEPVMRIPALVEDDTRISFDEAIMECLCINADPAILRKLLSEEPIVKVS